MIVQTNPLREPCRALREKEQDFLSVFIDNFIYSYRARIKGKWGGGGLGGKRNSRNFFLLFYHAPHPPPSLTFK